MTLLIIRQDDKLSRRHTITWQLFVQIWSHTLLTNMSKTATVVTRQMATVQNCKFSWINIGTTCLKKRHQCIHYVAASLA